MSFSDTTIAVRGWADAIVRGVATFLVSLALLGCGDAGPPEGVRAPDRVDVVWIVLDALRPDHLSSYGYERETSPAIDALAERGVLLENAWAQAPYTLLSVPSYMTGRYEPVLYQDPRHLDIWFLREPAPDEQLVSSIFREAGYATAMFSASPWYSADSRLGRSFETFGTLAHGEGEDPRAPDSNPALFSWIDAHAAEPFFLYVHALDTHDPHYRSNTDPRWLVEGYPARRAAALRRGWQSSQPPFDDRDREQIRGLYDGGIRVADAFVARVVEAVRAAGAFERTLFVVSSDHGELLGEDGRTLGHPSALGPDELLRVPLVLAGPGVPRGLRIRRLAQNADIVPTLVDLAGLGTNARFDGDSLRPLFESAPESLHGYAYARIQRALTHTNSNRVLVYPDRKYVVREGRGPRAGELAVQAFARPDRYGERQLVEETEVRLGEVRTEVREILQPLRMQRRQMPRAVPPVFELGHPTRKRGEQIVRDALDRADGRWSDMVLGRAARHEIVDRPFVVDRVLAGFPATEDLPEVELALRVPNGRYHVSASAHFAPTIDEPIGFRFRAGSATAWREVVLDAATSEEKPPDWLDLGTYEVTDGRFEYAIAAADSDHAALIGRLRFEVAGEEPGEDASSPTAEQRRAELERLRSLGYVE
jgi:arylsulfatase